MAERPDDQWTNEGMGDRGGAARHRPESSRDADERWPDEGFGDKGGAARTKIVDGDPKRQDEPQEQSGFWNSKPSDYEAGYGGGRERAEQLNSESFGETGWGGGRGESTGSQHSSDSKDYPEGARPADGSREWDERYARENGDKYGQGGGHPIVQRGGAQSRGGTEHQEQSLGDTKNLEGGYGKRETDSTPAGEDDKTKG